MKVQKLNVVKEINEKHLRDMEQKGYKRVGELEQAKDTTPAKETKQPKQ